MFDVLLKKRLLIVIIFCCFFISKAETFDSQIIRWKKSKFTVDFAKAKEGQYENYLKFLQLNWVEARKIALKRKQIKSYQLLVLPKDEKSDWNFILITEYGTQKQYNEMEQNFAAIFKQLGVKLIDGKSSRDMADIIVSKEFMSPLN